MTSTSSSWVVVGSGAALALLGNGNSCSQLHQLGCCSARLDDQLSEEGCFEMLLPPVRKNWINLRKQLLQLSFQHLRKCLPSRRYPATLQIHRRVLKTEENGPFHPGLDKPARLSFCICQAQQKWKQTLRRNAFHPGWQAPREWAVYYMAPAKPCK